jgi:DNA segregation ATPase FtsK/SpoIIIE, S-DNA-T family
MPDESSTSAANILLGAALSALSALSLAALASAASPDAAGLLSSAGSFLIEAFAWASLFVPLWLAGAAILAFLPGWRPGAVAALIGSFAPFIPLAAVARLSAQSEPFLSEHPYLATIGMPAILVAGIALALALSAFVIYAAKALSPAATPAGFREAGAPLLALEDSRSGSAKAGREAPRSGEGSFDFRVPELPPLPILHALDELPELPAIPELPEPGLMPGLEAEAPPPLAAADEEELALEEEEIEEVVDEPPADPLVEPPAPAPPIEEEGGIEFTSVPPARALAEAVEEERAAAALKRVLARRKDKPYAVPSEGILTAYPDGEYWIIDDKTRHSAEVLRETLAEFKIEAEVTGIRKGPVITMFEILPAPGVKLSKITTLADNIALRLAASSVRIVAPIPGKHAVGIEVPNDKRSIVSLKELIEAETFRTAKMEIPVVLGKDIAGEAKFIDLAQTPHLLIAGATGSGKSVCVNAMILSILFRRSPQEVKLLLIDPKIVELKLYNDIPHLLTPVITEPKRAFQALQYCICEMERRYSLLDHAAVRDIKSYNRKIRDKGYAAEHLPYIVVVIDEFADLMATTGKELESTIARLAAMSRAIGIHLVLATQRPSIDVITGLIKANIPSRIAFMVAGKFDSRIIIDAVGAEKLLGKGDMLVSTVSDSFPIREQGAYVSEEEVEKAVEFVKTLGEPEYIDDEIFIDEDDEDSGPSLFGDEDDDPLYEKALEIVLQQGKASASYIQRRLKIGYNRASRLVELMETKGIVGPAKGSKPRDIVHNPETMGRPMTAPANRGDLSRGDGQKQPSLMPGIETVPGQRVTGKDEEEE